MDERLRLLRSLRATRRFRAAEVSARQLADIVEVARWTGSARNRQPWRIAIVDAAAQRAQLARLGAYAGVLELAPIAILLAVDRRLGGADAEFDAGRFAQSLMLAAHALGLGSCPVTFFPEANARAATSLAGLDAPWLVRTALALGHPAPDGPPAGSRSAIPTGRISTDTLVVGR